MQVYTYVGPSTRELQDEQCKSCLEFFSPYCLSDNGLCPDCAGTHRQDSLRFDDLEAYLSAMERKARELGVY